MPKIYLFVLFSLFFTVSCSSIPKGDFKEIEEELDIVEEIEEISLSNIKISNIPVVELSSQIRNDLSPFSINFTLPPEPTNKEIDEKIAEVKANILSSVKNPINQNDIIINTLDNTHYLPNIASSVSMLLRASYANYEYDNEFIKQAGLNYISNLDQNKLFFSSEDVVNFSEGEENIKMIKDSLEGNSMKWMESVHSFFHHSKVQKFNYIKSIIKNDNGLEFFSNIPNITWEMKIDDWVHRDEKEKRWLYSVYDDYITLSISGLEHDDIINKIVDAYQRASVNPSGIEVLEGFLNSYAKFIDPHSSYLSPMSKINFQSRLRNFISGIGVVFEKEDGYVKIKEIIANSPAEEDENIKVGYKLIKVGSSEKNVQNVSDMSLVEVSSFISQFPEIYMVLVDSQKQEFKTTVSKRAIDTNSNRATANLIKVDNIFDKNKDNFKALVIKIPVFYQNNSQPSNTSSVSEDVKSILLNHSFNPPDMVLLDLRGNGGGVMSEAISVVSLFLKDSNVMQINNRANTVAYKTTPSDIMWLGPLAVLIDNRSASTSEIVTAALQDYQRALVLGDDTYGKGTAQSLLDLDLWAQMPSPIFGQLNLTSMVFFRPSGESLQLKGVIPDIYIGLKMGDLRPHGEKLFNNPIPHDSAKSLISSPVPIQGPNPWQLRKNEIQTSSNKRWQEKPWSDLWHQVAKANIPNQKRMLSLGERKEENQIKTDLQNNLLNSLPSADQQMGRDVILSESITVAQDAFFGVNYPHHVIQTIKMEN